MPHPKGHVKLTGDTHPPELEWDADDMGTDEFSVPPEGDADQRGARRTALRAIREAAPPASTAPRSFQPDVLEQAREQVRASPWKVLGGAFLLGFVLVKLFR